MNIPNITEEYEKFDISNFGSDRNEILTRDNDTIYRSHNKNFFFETDKNGNDIRSFSKGGDNSTIKGYDYSQNPIFGVYKSFYPDGSIMEKGVYCWFGFRVGVWFEYEENHQIKDSINYDEGFKFGVKDIFKFCQSNGIILTKNVNNTQTKIFRKDDVKGRKIWIIHYPNDSVGLFTTIIVDGNSGKVLSENQSLVSFE